MMMSRENNTSTDGAQTIVEFVWNHVVQTPNKIAIRYLNGDGPIDELTYQRLWMKAAGIADKLRGSAKPGDNAVLVFPHGIDFVTSFLGCMLAEVIPAPSSAPRKNKKRDSHSKSARFVSICEHAKPAVLLTHSSIKELLRTHIPASMSLECVAVDELPVALVLAPPPSKNPSDIAFLQYTSGSTGNPKGVVVTHGNLIGNQVAIHDSTKTERQKVVSVSWLPMFHDMGLVSGLLHPLYLGGEAVLFSPSSFVASPIRWLRAITKYGATLTGAPNFAYELCARQIPLEEDASLDLSSVKTCYNGAEPVSALAVRSFIERFSKCGFRPKAYFPCFGMAESTLLISGGPTLEQEPKILSVRRSGLKEGRVEVASENAADMTEVVGCGYATTGTEILVVDPETNTSRQPLEVGEFWIRGTSVAVGYLDNEQATNATFGAVPKGRTNPYLRTGDLGFLDESGEVFVVGRIKDLIVVGGKNVYPSDVEEVVQGCLELGPTNHVVAVGIESSGTEKISILVECNGALRKAARQEDKTEIEKVADSIRLAILEVFESAAGSIGFIRTGCLPVTSSGKVQRGECKTVLMNGNEDLLHLSSSFVIPNGQQPMKKQSDFRNEMQRQSFDDMKRVMSDIFTSTQMARIEEQGGSTTLDELGLDSLAKTSVVAELERKLDIRFDSAHLPPDGQLFQLSDAISKQRRNTNGNKSVPAPHSSPQANPSAYKSATPERRADLQVDSKVTSLTDFLQRESRDLFEKTTEFRQWYNDADRRGFKKYLLPIIEQRGGRALVGADKYTPEREVILFGSADYLGLAHDPRVTRAAADAILEHGCNVASVPLVAGSTPMHKVLEERLCEMMDMEGCVLFPTGHSANMATIAALCSQHDTVVVDNRVHYSILEGVRLAHCEWRTFGHNDPDKLREVLESVRSKNKSRGVLVVIEGVYGIDGDLPRLDELISVAREFDARVMMDDAHSIGVLGEGGMGTASHLGTQNADIIMGSLSKSLGSFGGFILASRDVVDYLRFYAKAISFAVGLPVVNAAAALEAMDIIRDEPQRLTSLTQKSTYLRDALIAEGFDEPQLSQSTIMSLKIGNEEVLRDVSKELFDAGVWAEGLPFPAVSRGQERLRFRVRDCHTLEDLKKAAELTGEVCRRLVQRSVVQVVNPGFSDEPEWQVVSSLSEELANRVCELAEIQAKHLDASLPWVSRDFITKYFRRDSYWEALPTEHCWHLGFKFGQLVAAFSVDRAEVASGNGTKRSALLGAFCCEINAEPLLVQKVRDVVTECEGECELVAAPATFPIPVFGAGVQAWENGKPFLESTLPTQMSNALRGIGFRVAGSKRYYRVGLHSQPNAIAPQERIAIRDFRRAEYRDEVENFVSPIFDKTIAKLDLCSPLPLDVMTSLVQDLRELVMPGFWLLAEYDGEPAGFAFCYPNLTDEFKRVGGNADIADYQRIQEKMETSSEAFLAWLAVDPKFANRGVSESLLQELHHRLLRRGYTHMWMSWEFVDGAASTEQHLEQIGTLEQLAEMPFFYAGQPVREAKIPKPHFGVRRKRQDSQGYSSEF